MREQSAVLKHIPHAPLVRGQVQVRLGVQHRAALHLDQAIIGLQKARYRIDNSRFTGTRRAEQSRNARARSECGIDGVAPKLMRNIDRNAHDRRAFAATLRASIRAAIRRGWRT